MRPKIPAPRNGVPRRVLLAGLGAAAATAAASPTQAANVATIRIGYLRSTRRRPTISLLDKPAPNNGLAGARMAMDDDNTTGGFMNQAFEVINSPVGPNTDSLAALADLTKPGPLFVLTDLPAAAILKLSDAARASGSVILNVDAPDDRLRMADCRANVIHVAPSRAMLTDALAQYMLWKKWTRWVLISGEHPDDILLADSYRRSARTFGIRIVMDKVSKDTGGSRQTDTGLLELQKQIPLLTQDAPEHDVVVAADENNVFAGYLPYRTWSARPVAGSAGLEPVSWSPNSVSWGGDQLQNRFNSHFHRLMTPLDMNAWTAVRMVGEAASRAGALDLASLFAYMKSPRFGIGAYKGQALTLRDWDLQLRQPIFLADGRTVVSISPQPGFLHQVTELDTLGFDRPQTTCHLK